MRKLLVQFVFFACMLVALPVASVAQEDKPTDEDNVHWSINRVFRVQYPDTWHVTNERDELHILTDHANALILVYFPDADFDSALAAVESGIAETRVSVLKDPLEFAVDEKQVAMAVVDADGRTLFYAVEDNNILISGFAYSVDEDDSQLEGDLIAVLERLEIFNYEPRTLPILDLNTLESGDADAITTMLDRLQLIHEVDERLLNEVYVVSALKDQMMLEESETPASAFVSSFVVSVRPRDPDQFFCGITIGTEDIAVSVGLLDGETIALLDDNRISEELGLFLTPSPVNYAQPHHFLFIIQDNRIHVFADGRPVIEGWPLHTFAALDTQQMRKPSITMFGSSCVMTNVWVYSLQEPVKP